MESCGILKKGERTDDGSLLHFTIEDGVEPGVDVWSADPVGLIDLLDFEELTSLAGVPASLTDLFLDPKTLCMQSGGWQSWSAGWELGPGERLPRRTRFVKELYLYTSRQGEQPGRHEELGHFIMYLRVGNHYLCLASLEGDGLPPLGFRINRKRRTVALDVFAPGKQWKEKDRVAEVEIFYANGFFALKDRLHRIYSQDRVFASLDFLSGQSIPSFASSNPALEAANCSLPRARLPGGYSSWYNHYSDIDEELLKANLAALKSAECLAHRLFVEPGRPGIFQIDDGWQRAVGEWEVSEERFPSGLRAISDTASSRGLIPGLWMAPFLVTKQARFFTERPGWLLSDAKGRPIPVGWNNLWGGVFYALDLSQVAVLDYLKSLIDRAVNEWGFRFIKLDFLYAGLFHGNFVNGGSAWEHYRKAVSILTSCKTDSSGRPVAYLGCGLPLGQSYRFFPLSRIGADTRETWDWGLPRMMGHVGRPSALVNLRDTLGRAYLDGTVYRNDPDAVFLRHQGCDLGEREKELVILTNFLLGSCMMSSDDPALFGSEREFTIRMTGLLREIARSGDEFGSVRLDRDVYRIESRSRRFWGLVNLREKEWTLGEEEDLMLSVLLDMSVFLVDNRASEKAFKPHSITLFKTVEGK